jgi:DNA invertase Pin-like site-specific DNA recombinase
MSPRIDGTALGLRVGIYGRYSDSNQDDGFSIEYQLSECTDYLNKHGMSLHKTYIDQAVTGTKVAGRDAFHELLHDVKNELIDVVVVYKFSRIFRNALESHKYRQLFKKHGVKLISVTQQVDDETSSGKLMIGVMANIDEYQSAVISDHVKSAMREMVSEGFFAGGTVPYGYKLETVQHGKKTRKRYVPDEFEKEVVKKLFELYADNYSLKYLQDYTKSIGAVARSGKPFSIQTIARMLRNDFYIGILRYNAQGHEPIVVNDVIPSIIEKGLWDRVQYRHSRQKDVRPRKRKDLYSLTGKIVCGYCDNHFFGIRSGSVQRGKHYDYKYYVCSTSKTYSTCSCKRVRKDFLEKAVLDKIKKHILNEKTIYQIANEIIAKLGENPDGQKNRLKEFKKELVTVKSQISELLDLKSLKLVDNVYLVEHMKPLQERAKELEMQIYAIEQQTKMVISHSMIVDYLNKMMDISNTTDDEVLQTIFDNFVEKIVIDNEEIKIFLFVSPPSVDKFYYKGSHGQPSVNYYSKIKRV